MKNATARDEAALAQAYQEGLDDLNGPRDGIVVRALTGGERALAKRGAHPWALLPGSVVHHRDAGRSAPAFDDLEEHEQLALQYIAAIIEHGRSGSWLSDAVSKNGHDPLYFESALILEDTLENAIFLRGKDGDLVVKGPKWRDREDALSMASGILDAVKKTGIAPIARSKDDPRRAKR